MGGLALRIQQEKKAANEGINLKSHFSDRVFSSIAWVAFIFLGIYTVYHNYNAGLIKYGLMSGIAWGAIGLASLVAMRSFSISMIRRENAIIPLIALLVSVPFDYLGHKTSFTGYEEVNINKSVSSDAEIARLQRKIANTKTQFASHQYISDKKTEPDEIKLEQLMRDKPTGVNKNDGGYYVNEYYVMFLSFAVVMSMLAVEFYLVKYDHIPIANALIKFKDTEIPLGVQRQKYESKLQPKKRESEAIESSSSPEINKMNPEDQIDALDKAGYIFTEAKSDTGYVNVFPAYKITEEERTKIASQLNRPESLAVHFKGTENRFLVHSYPIIRPPEAMRS